MKQKWVGDGGTAFTLSANVLEAKFLKMIKDLEEEVNDLRSAELSVLGLDALLAKSIEGAISGLHTVVENAIGTATNDVKK